MSGDDSSRINLFPARKRSVERLRDLADEESKSPRISTRRNSGEINQPAAGLSRGITLAGQKKKRIVPGETANPFDRGYKGSKF